MLPPSRGKSSVVFLSSWNDTRHLKRQGTQFWSRRWVKSFDLFQRSELERARLVREARAIYDSMFPGVDAISEQGNDKTPLHQG